MIAVVKVALPLPTMVCVPGVSGVKCTTQPCPTDRPVVPAGRPKRLSAGRTMFISRVSTSFTGTEWPSTVTDGAVCTSACSAQARNSASVVRFGSSNVLHSFEDATTRILVPGFTVHDGTPLGPNGATVPPRFQHANAAPPLPNEFWADGVSSTLLAQLLRADLLPEAWIAPPQVRQLRALLRHRASLVRLGTQQRNRIHAVAADHGYDRSASYWTGPGRGWLAEPGPAAGVAGDRHGLP